MASYFISDLHLSNQQPKLLIGLLQLCQQIAADAEELFILGDLFDAWIGDDAAPAELLPMQQALLRLAMGGCKLYFVHGNRDFLLGQDFADSCQMRILPSICKRRVQGQQVLLLHGDELCTDDLPYQAFRQQVRNSKWQTDFLSQPLEARLAQAKAARHASQAHTSSSQMDIMDVNEQAVAQCFAEQDCQTMIHGHTHRPDRHQYSDGRVRWVLGDWHPDQLNYLRIEQQDWRFVRHNILG